MEKRSIIHIVDVDPRNRAQFARAVFEMGHHAEVYDDAFELTSHMPRQGIVLAHDDPEAGGIAGLVDAMAERGAWLPVIAMANRPCIDHVVAAMRAGAFDYLSKPLHPPALELAIERVSREAATQAEYRKRSLDARTRISMLSNREREVLDRLAQGCSNKAIARELDISPRTVEIHRGNMMEKLGARHAAEAVRLRLEASMGDWLH
ncbi:response regulator transcription factor [Croceicoccus gelatinilyticus]|uniref:response regulator transcription factor n=1 Tax=Croceicoccus gelatinilyticus TaxID=2835536 RepID=UPI001BCD19FA|nr:LuxR C-terminal-related transcriptional regulator [Croceicoccus gelatinilyticus]MBS7669099.1 helix-turn-helix transcriptional regulator [Croceicoccus gelatinilyticus]